MKYVLYLLMIAVIFGLIALLDFLFQKLFPKSGPEKNGKAVRLPRYSFILGLIMSLLGLIALLFLPLKDQRLLQVGCVVVLVMGLYLLVDFLRFGIFYDDEGFVYRTLTRKARRYRYEDITGQRSFLARSGLNTSLYVNGDEIQLYSAMQGLSDFLNKAFYAWCAARDLDPDHVDHDPRTLSYFPEPADDTPQSP